MFVDANKRISTIIDRLNLVNLFVFPQKTRRIVWRFIYCCCRVCIPVFFQRFSMCFTGAHCVYEYGHTATHTDRLIQHLMKTRTSNTWNKCACTCATQTIAGQHSKFDLCSETEAASQRNCMKVTVAIEESKTDGWCCNKCNQTKWK